LFVADPEDENAFALKEADLLRIGPLHEAVMQIGKRPPAARPPTEAATPSEKAEDFAGPKTRGASKRKVVEPGGFATPATVKRTKA
jgi:hypothetical protein